MIKNEGIYEIRKAILKCNGYHEKRLQDSRFTERDRIITLCICCKQPISENERLKLHAYCYRCHAELYPRPKKEPYTPMFNTQLPRKRSKTATMEIKVQVKK